MKLIKLISWIIVAFLIFIGCQKKAGKEAVSAETVKATIENYIKQNSTPEGTFALEDTVEGKTWQLVYDYVHDTVNKTEDGRYFACVDLVEGENRLDVDVYVKKADDKLQVDEIKIHKVNGVSRW